MLNRQRINIELFLVSFIMLFIELVVIRWVSTEIRIFAYINNLLLLSCFIGIGLGCYLSEKRTDISITAVALSILTVIITLPMTLEINGQYLHLFKDVPLLLSSFTDSVIWVEPEVNSVFFMTILGMASTLAVFFVILVLFIPLGQILGNALNRHSNIITAYSINIIAGILGMWCFSAYSFLYTPPFHWFAFIVAFLLILLLIRSERSAVKMVSIAVLLLLAIGTMLVPHRMQKGSLTLWSPYQKLTIQPYFPEKNIRQGYEILVNDTGYMLLIDLSDDFIKEHPHYLKKEMRKLSYYDIPYMFKKGAKDILILGAGAGNDIAGALRNGVETVEAVEIDPGIHSLGSQFHPERPYLDPRVDIIIDDARSFLKKTTKQYDIIIFGFLDAHTLSSSYNNMRIDHYVYTKESFQEAKNLLRKDSILIVSFYSQRPWIRKRIYDLMENVFGHPPKVFLPWSGISNLSGWPMYVTAIDKDVVNRAIEDDEKLDKFIKDYSVDFSRKTSLPSPLKLTTDDWPYLYLEKPLIPKMHLCVMAIVLILILIGKKTMFSKKQKLNLHFFFLGAAFLLLEFQNISKTTLLFGSTWLVNTFTISAIMALILLANFFVRAMKIQSLKPIYLMLVLSIIVLFLVPLKTFNVLGHVYKGIFGSIILNMPIFFAGIIFIRSFKKTQYKNLAFGSNLIGAAVGGTLESLSFVFGINTLLLVVLGFYALSFAYLKRE